MLYIYDIQVQRSDVAVLLYIVVEVCYFWHHQLIQESSKTREVEEHKDIKISGAPIPPFPPQKMVRKGTQTVVPYWLFCPFVSFFLTYFGILRLESWRYSSLIKGPPPVFLIAVAHRRAPHRPENRTQGS